MATKKEDVTESFEVFYDDAAGHRRVQGCVDEGAAKAAAQDFSEEEFTNIEIQQVTVTRTPVSFKAKTPAVPRGQAVDESIVLGADDHE